jgi:tripartite-type tricarboxylate transporter receptor subunit TctC
MTAALTRRALVGATLALGVRASIAQPAGSVRLLVGYAPGGPVDSAARLFAPALSKELGANVVVENKPGANATLAGDLVAKAAPDGATLWFVASPTLTISPNVMKRMPFDPVHDFTSLGPVLSYYNVLVVNKDQPFKTVGELTAFARANPGKVTYGSAGVGGSNHLCGELFAHQSKTKMTHVPYKGNAPAMTDAIGGQLTMMFDIVGSARQYIAGGKVRALAVTSPRRNPSLPDVPTMAEAGLSGFDVGGWYAVYGPPAMPVALAARYERAIAAALVHGELKAKLEELGYEPWSGSPEAVTLRVKHERAMWSTVTKGIEIE